MTMIAITDHLANDNHQEQASVRGGGGGGGEGGVQLHIHTGLHLLSFSWVTSRWEKIKRNAEL